MVKGKTYGPFKTKESWIMTLNTLRSEGYELSGYDDYWDYYKGRTILWHHSWPTDSSRVMYGNIDNHKEVQLLPPENFNEYTKLLWR